MILVVLVIEEKEGIAKLSFCFRKLFFYRPCENVVLIYCSLISSWLLWINSSPSASPQSEFSRWICCCWISSSSGEPGGRRSASTWDTAPPGRTVQQDKRTDIDTVDCFQSTLWDRLTRRALRCTFFNVEHQPFTQRKHTEGQLCSWGLEGRSWARSVISQIRWLELHNTNRANVKGRVEERHGQKIILVSFMDPKYPQDIVYFSAKHILNRW